MKILFLSTKNLNAQGDYLEITIINGMRKLLGNDFIEYPRKDILYGDFTKSPKSKLHGQGFSLLRYPIEDVDRNDVFNQKYDVIIYGSGHLVGEEIYIDEIDKLANNNVWILDGHDLYGDAPIKKMYNNESIIANQFSNSFKRELVFEEEKVYPTGYGIPEEIILEIDYTKKTQLHQKSYPKFAKFENPTDLGGSRNHHIFNSEEEYFDDMSSSWFGLTCIKGGWDSLRHYEIIAAGSLLLFRDYDKKPPNCSPQNLPCFSYENINELEYLFSNLIVKNKPTKQYIEMINKQRKWLYQNGTTLSRAKKVIEILNLNTEN